jgi:hypothetical protein
MTAIVNEDAAAVRRYRQHARKIRGIAAKAEEPGVRSALLWIVRDYERMAVVRLRIGKLARSMRSRNLDSAYQPFNFAASNSLMPGFRGP